MMGARAILATGSGYLVSILVSALVGIVSIPVVISIAGTTTWSAIALAQATGAIGATIVSFGWPVLGPAEVAAGDRAARARLFRVSLWSRAFVLFPTLAAVAGVVAIQATPIATVSVLLIAASTPVVGALTASWFFVGEARPSKLVLLDVIPRAGGSLLGIALILASGDVAWFVLAQFAGQLMALILSWFSVRKRYGRPPRIAGREVMRTAWRGRSGFLNAILTSFYQNSPLLLVGWLAPEGLPTYAMADRLYRIGSLALAPVTQVAQGYVPAHQATHTLDERVRRALHIAAGLACVTVVAFGLAAPPLGHALSAGSIEIPLTVSLTLGLALALTLLSSIVGRACLVPLGQTTALVVAATCAALIGLVSMWVGGILAGVVGVAIGYLLAEFVAAAVVCGSLRRSLRTRQGVRGPLEGES